MSYTLERAAVVIVFFIGAALGIRSTTELVRIYRYLKRMHPPVRTIIARTFVIVSGVVTVAVAYFGALALWGLAGNPRPVWAPFISLLLTALVSLIPLLLVRTFHRVAEEVTHTARGGETRDIESTRDRSGPLR